MAKVAISDLTFSFLRADDLCIPQDDPSFTSCINYVAYIKHIKYKSMALGTLIIT